MENVEVSCGEDNGVGRIGLRISSIFVVGIGSLLGMKKPCGQRIGKMLIDHRSTVTSVSQSDKTCSKWQDEDGIFHCQVLWLGGYYWHCFHTCKSLSIISEKGGHRFYHVNFLQLIYYKASRPSYGSTPIAMPERYYYRL